MSDTNTVKNLMIKHLGSVVNSREFTYIFFDNNSINLYDCVLKINKYPELNDFLEEYLVICDDINKVYTCYKRTVLHCACNNLIVKTVEILINAGINVNLQDVNGMTALHYITFYSRNSCSSAFKFKIIELLIQAGADVFNLKDVSNKAPIDYFSQELLEYCQIDKDTQTIGIKSGKLTKRAKK